LPVLQDPNVASSSLDNRVAFLRSKNLTEEEISASLARAGQSPYSGSSSPSSQPQHHASSDSQHQQQHHYQQPRNGSYPPQYPPQYGGWQQQMYEPRRDWRDWFIMATVVGGVGYGLYELGKVCDAFCALYG